VDAFHDAVEHGSLGIGDDGHLIGPDEQARLAIGQALAIERELAPGQVHRRPRS
jgi:hypothetical protein